MYLRIVGRKKVRNINHSQLSPNSESQFTLTCIAYFTITYQTQLPLMSIKESSRLTILHFLEGGEGVSGVML